MGEGRVLGAGGVWGAWEEVWAVTFRQRFLIIICILTGECCFGWFYSYSNTLGCEDHH